METRSALLIFGTCGFTSVLVDLDHAAAFLIWYFWFPTLNEGRIFHPYLFFASSLIILGLFSYLGGLHIKLVLEDRKR